MKRKERETKRGRERIGKERETAPAHAQGPTALPWGQQTGDDAGCVPTVGGRRSCRGEAGGQWGSRRRGEKKGGDGDVEDDDDVDGGKVKWRRWWVWWSWVEKVVVVMRRMKKTRVEVMIKR